MFRVVGYSLNYKVKLPGFNDWIKMGADGFKVFIVSIIYLIIPSMVILFITPLTLDVPGVSILGIFGLTPLEVFVYNLSSIIWENISSFIFIGYYSFGFFVIFYMIIIIPLFLIAIANMAYYGGELKSAFKLREIIEEISIIGWLNLIKWYILTGIIFLIIELTLLFISYISFAINLNSIADILLWKLLALTLIPYSYIFMARSVALFYMPDKEED